MPLLSRGALLSLSVPFVLDVFPGLLPLPGSDVPGDSPESSFALLELLLEDLLELELELLDSELLELELLLSFDLYTAV